MYKEKFKIIINKFGIYVVLRIIKIVIVFYIVSNFFSVGIVFIISLFYNFFVIKEFCF